MADTESGEEKSRIDELNRMAQWASSLPAEPKRMVALYIIERLKEILYEH